LDAWALHVRTVTGKHGRAHYALLDAQRKRDRAANPLPVTMGTVVVTQGPTKAARGSNELHKAKPGALPMGPTGRYL
jgi:hypothetical protein